VFPIAVALFREADVPKRLIAGAIALGSFTFTMTALPGTPAIQNAIPMPFFGTTPFAAPGLGTLAALIMLGGGMLWLNHRARVAAAHGEGYAASDTASALTAAATAGAPAKVVIRMRSTPAVPPARLRTCPDSVWPSPRSPWSSG
jgi:H+/gluconate symporter-like permease